MTDTDLTTLPKTRKEAIEQGSKYYFPNKKCKRGHTAKYVITGGCYECSLFTNRKLYKEQHEKYIERIRRRRKEKPEIDKNYYKNNKEKILKRQKLFEVENPLVVKGWKKTWAENNKDSIKKARQNWEKNNPDKIRSINHAKRARRKSAEGFFTKEDIKKNYI